jgi:hypothetical protein
VKNKVTLNTSELTGAALDWAVAKCEGKSVETNDDWVIDIALDTILISDSRFQPSSDWAKAGPIIHREGILMGPSPFPGEPYAACVGSEWDTGAFTQSGSTPLIAAMRCFVTSKLGPQIEVEEELAARTRPSPSGWVPLKM